MRRFLIVLAFMPALFSVFGTELFREGRTAFSIVISSKASPCESFAAEELGNYLKKISKADFPILRNDSIPAENALVIATAASFPALKALAPDVAPEEQDSLRVVAKDGNIYFLGNNNRSALYAVYAFLEDVFGVRWLFMGEAGEVVPEKTAFVFDRHLDMRQTSRFRYRGFHVVGTFYHDEMELWMARNRLNMIYSNPPNGKQWVVDWNRKRAARGFHIMFANHNIAIYDKKVFEKQPEIFALVNGKRIPDQLCWSNPVVDGIMVERFVKAIQEQPEVEIINMFPADNMNYCQCKECSKQPRKELWFNMLKRLSAGIRKVYPDKKIASIAYQSYMEPPEADLKGVDFVEYCMYNRCYVHRFDECPANRKVLKSLEAWKAKNVGVPVYGYEFDNFATQMYMPFGKMLEDQLNVFERIGLWGSIPEAMAPNYKGRYPSPSGRNTGEHALFEYYLYAKLLWDDKASFGSVADDYSKNAFGPAAPYIRRYYEMMANAWSGMKIHYSYFFNSHLGCAQYLLNPQLIADGQALLKAADDAADKIDEPSRRKNVQENLAREKDLFAGWVKTYNDYMSSSQGRKILLPKAKAPLDFSCAAVLPDFLTKNGKPPVETTVKMNYDDENLYFDIVCHEPEINEVVANIVGRDAPLWNDETVEIFIAVPNDTEGNYRHLIFNPKGERYDAIALGGMTFNTAWNPQWQVRSFVGKDAWGAKVSIPFSDLGRKPSKDEVWMFTVNRNSGISRRNRPNSGFPDSTVHDPNAFGAMQFCEEDDIRPTFFFSRHSEGDVLEMKMLMENAGFQTIAVRSEKDIPEDLPSQKVYVIRWTRGVALPESFNKKLLRDMQNGALVMFMCWGELELEKYFNDQTFKLEWSGWKIDPKRKSFNVLPGDWQTKPCDMRDLVNKGMTPANGYRPVTQGKFVSMGELKMQDGSFYSFLLTRKVGKGMLVVCSGDYGMAGGVAMFGSRKNQSIMLLENMYQYMLDNDK